MLRIPINGQNWFQANNNKLLIKYKHAGRGENKPRTESFKPE